MRTLALTCATICATLLTSSPPAAAADDTNKPVTIAVFNVEAKGISFEADTLERLTAYLASKLSASARFRVIPRGQLKKRLRAQKRESFARNVDKASQIAIGKELAAQKSLATQVLRVGSSCAVTATVYDVGRAAADGGATARGKCDEDAVVASLDRVAAQLTRGAPGGGGGGAAGGGGGGEPGVVEGPRVAIDVVSEPPGAELFVDGQPRGRTPSRLDLAVGAQVKLSVEKRGYRSVKRTLRVRERETLRVALELTGEGRGDQATRTEWFGFELGGGALLALNDATNDNGGMIFAVIDLFTLKWQHFFWSIIEFAGGGFPDVGGLVLLQTQLGYPLYFGARGQHHVRVGLDLGAGLLGDTFGFALGPTVRYHYQSSARFLIGVSFRTVFQATSTDAGKSGAALLSLVMGWSSLPD